MIYLHLIGDGHPVSVEPKAIAEVSPYESGSKVGLKAGGAVYVRESPDWIKERLSSTMRVFRAEGYCWVGLHRFEGTRYIHAPSEVSARKMIHDTWPGFHINNIQDITDAKTA